MMFFVYHLQTYSPKNRAWKKVIDYVEKYKDVLIKNVMNYPHDCTAFTLYYRVKLLKHCIPSLLLSSMTCA